METSKEGPADAYARIRMGEIDGPLADLSAAMRHRTLDSSDLWVMACIALRKGAWGSAETALCELVDDDPSRSALAHGMLAFALEMQGKSAEALRYYRVAVEGGQAGDAVFYHHGLVAYRLGRYDESVASWSVLLQRHPGHSELNELVAYARYAAGRVLIERENYEAAIQQLAACEKSPAVAVPKEALAELHLHAAAQLLSGHDPDKDQRAWRHVVEASKRRPGDPRVLYRLALREYAVGAHSRADQLLARAAQGRPDDPRIRYAQAVCRVRLGEQDDAARELTALHEKEGGERVALALAASHIRAGRWDAARTLLLTCPQDPRAEALLAECDYRSGQPAGEEAGPWSAACQVREGRVEAASEVIRRADADPSGRLQRELALLLRRAALAAAENAETDGLSRAADLLEQSQRLAAVPTGFAHLHAIVLALDGRFPAAVRMLDAACERDPADHRQAHTLALILLTALRAEAVPPKPGWQRCVAAWGAVLHDEAFWAYRRAEAERRYGEPVPQALVASLPIELQRHLEGLLPAAAHDRHRITVLSLLQREAEAAQALADTGGLPIRHDDGRRATLVCGPLRLVELGRTELFGSFLDAQTDAPPRLTRLFSQLGFAETRLAAGTVREALDAALDLRCPSCRGHAPDASGPDAARRPRLCGPDCSTFGALNPAYAAAPARPAGPGGPGGLARDAHALVMDIWLLLGRNALSAAKPDLRWVHECLGAAIVLSLETDRYWDTQQAIVTMVRERAEGMRDNDRLDEAVALLEMVHTKTGANHREPLAGLLSAVLTDRAIIAVNGNAERLDGPADDLRRAVRLNPYRLNAQVSLGAVLRMLAHRKRFAGSAQGARRCLREAETCLAAALALWPGEQTLEDLRKGVQDDLAYLADLLGPGDDEG
ncbi:tetratricopeptide repeat protein [Actinomadura sp. 3N508]|uniref:tetratricopeptide repeat protein n=1 Tax=Actinomadura sp. 3N508 TaxID=3375153 RepID=UPI003796167E